MVSQAEVMCMNDPLVYNELGVCAYRELRYGDAVVYFNKALSFVSPVCPTRTFIIN